MEVALPEDDADNMEIVCYALHLRHDHVTFTPSLKDLGDIAVLAEKYDLTSAMKAISHVWTGLLRECMAETSCEMLMIIAYLFQQGQLFESLSEHLILKCDAYHVRPSSDNWPRDLEPSTTMFRKSLPLLPRESCQPADLPLQRRSRNKREQQWRESHPLSSAWSKRRRQSGLTKSIRTADATASMPKGASCGLSNVCAKQAFGPSLNSWTALSPVP